MSLLPWICPVCRQRLTATERQYRCANGHSFDVAREGYVNLLPANQRRSADPGDDRQMLRNRREFLEQGYYAPLADKLSQQCMKMMGSTQQTFFAVLDVGCGEGYFTGALAKGLNAPGQQQSFSVSGIDISKHAIRMASKSYRTIAFAVASSAALPVEDGSVDCLTRVFAPAPDLEIRRVLKPGGHFIRVTPGPRHLYNLRKQIYDDPLEHDLITAEVDGLFHLEREVLDYRVEIRSEGDVGRLLCMTPYYWQISQECRQRIMAMSELAVEVSFCLDLFRNTKA
jgi:23S rRNA (guanine745-N1)-methyltransferase